MLRRFKFSFKMTETVENIHSSYVNSEEYPISQPLATILCSSVYVNTDNEDDYYLSLHTKNNIEVVKESVEDALHNLIRNCFVAMDEMYFYT